MHEEIMGAYSGMHMYVLPNKITFKLPSLSLRPLPEKVAQIVRLKPTLALLLRSIGSLSLVRFENAQMLIRAIDRALQREG